MQQQSDMAKHVAGQSAQIRQLTLELGRLKVEREQLHETVITQKELIDLYWKRWRSEMHAREDLEIEAGLAPPASASDPIFPGEVT